MRRRGTGAGSQLRAALRGGGTARRMGWLGDGFPLRVQPELRLLPEREHQPGPSRRRDRPGRTGAGLLSLDLARGGCHNLNLVTPTHQAAAIVAALARAAENGFDLPVVSSCGGYESVDVLRLLDGVVDVSLPDVKYGTDDAALRYSGTLGYTEAAEAALMEMHAQAGDLSLEGGIARRGLLVRHLVLPGGLAASPEALRIRRPRGPIQDVRERHGPVPPRPPCAGVPRTRAAGDAGRGRRGARRGTPPRALPWSTSSAGRVKPEVRGGCR